MTPDTLPAHFWAKVNKTETCWLWTAYANRHGYGMVATKTRVPALAHRLTYEAAKGTIPPGMDVDHMCHVPACVNPDHLQAVSRSLNNQNRIGARIDSSTGVRGVGYDSRRGKYYVRVTVNGRANWGGYFLAVAEAESAAIALRNKLMTNNLQDRRQMKAS